MSIDTACNCPICKSSNCIPFNKIEHRQLLICSGCRHVFWECMPKEEELEEYYRRLYTTRHGQADIQTSNIEYYRSHALELAKEARRPPAELTLVDVGCSFPTLLVEARKLGFKRVIGVEHDREATRWGRERGIEMIDPTELGHIDGAGTVDILRYSHVLEHVLKPVGVLRKHVRKLSRNGIVYITQPNIPILVAAPADVSMQDASFPNHLHFFSPRSVYEMLRQAGLVPYRFFTVTNEHDARRTYERAYDREGAERLTIPLLGLGEDVRGDLNNAPFFFGENSAAYARLEMR